MAITPLEIKKTIEELKTKFQGYVVTYDQDIHTQKDYIDGFPDFDIRRIHTFTIIEKI